MKRLGRQPGRVLANPVEGRVRNARLTQPFLLQVLIYQRDSRRPQRGRRRRSPSLPILAFENDVEAGRGVGVGGNVGHLPETMPEGLRDGLLVAGQSVESAGTAAAAAFLDRAAPCRLLEVDALLRFEDGGSTDRGHGRQRRRKPSGRALLLAACESAAVAAG